MFGDPEHSARPRPPARRARPLAVTAHPEAIVRWSRFLFAPLLLAVATDASAQRCALANAADPLPVDRIVRDSITRADCQLKPDSLAHFVAWYGFDWPSTGLAQVRVAYTGYYLEGPSALLSGDGELVAVLDEELKGWEDATLWLPAGRYYLQLSHNLNEGIERIPVELSVRRTTVDEVALDAPTLRPWSGASFRRLCTRASSGALTVNQVVQAALPRPREGCTLARAAPSFQPFVDWTDEVVMYRFDLDRAETVRLSYQAPGEARAVLLSGRFGDPFGPANDDPDDPGLRPRPLATAESGKPVDVRLQPGQYFVAVTTRPDLATRPYTLEVRAEPDSR
jgi:hypothetical protein